uniref:Fibronectin type-III domain-containing protein n=1 Tax=viral metagenome TaxID=1070528 RepID=A0A6C0E4Y4_9ZZZZ
MSIHLVANNTEQSRTVSWTMDLTFVLVEQYLLVSDATSIIGDITKVTLAPTETFANLSSFPKNSKLIVTLTQVDANLGTRKSLAVTLDSLQIPLRPTLVSATGIDKGIAVSFTVPEDSPTATQLVIILTNAIDDMASFETAMPSLGANGRYELSVTSEEMSIIQDNDPTPYEVSIMLRSNNGDSDVSNVLSATPSNLPNAPNLISVETGGSGSATATWDAPIDSAYWTATAVTLYVYNNSTFSTTEHLVTPLTSTSKTINYLTNGTSYSFYLKYSNAVGEGQSSNTTSFTPYDKPDPVGDFTVAGFISSQNLSIYQTTPSQYLVVFGRITTTRTTPNATTYTMNGNGATITGYNIYNDSGALLQFFPYQELQSGDTQFLNITTNYFTGNGLIPIGSTFNYYCRTVAVSADGVRVLSDPVTAIFTVHSNPLAVTDLTAVGLDQSISLSWSASITRGNPIQIYSIRDINNVEVSNTTSTNYTITNLPNGVAQTYTVVAVTQSDRQIATNLYESVESQDSPSATATPHKAPVIENVTINGLVMTLSITDNGLPATNVTAFAVDNTGNSAIIQEALRNNNQVTFRAPLTNITSYMVFVTNSPNKMSNIVYQVT